MFHQKFAGLPAVVLFAGLVAVPSARAATEVYSAHLAGDNEVPPINTAGSADFRMEIDTSGSTPVIQFTLTFSDLSTSAILSHLHFAPAKVAGGVMIWLCGGGGQPACPAATSGTITGTITAANVNNLTAQGIAAGDLDSALDAVRDGSAYCNLHTTKFPGGEIRGQVRRGGGHANANGKGRD